MTRRRVLVWAGIVAIAGMAAAAPVRAEDVSAYTVTLAPETILPEPCGILAGNAQTLPVAIVSFQDTQPERQVAELKKGDETFPVYLDRPIGQVVSEGLSLFLTRCGYKTTSAIAKGSEKPVIALTGEVADFRVNWQKKLITAKGGGQLWVRLKLIGPYGNQFTFEFKVNSEAKGLRKKGISQIESELADAYRQFLVQVSQYAEFQRAFVKLSEAPRD